jgi:hypothetical protein
MSQLQQQIQTQLLDGGASLVGFADVTDLPESARGDFTQAITGRLWQPGMTREDLYDAQACCRMAKERCARIVFRSRSVLLAGNN